MVICQNCGTENPEGNRFCGNCAHALELTCANCGAANPPAMKFCGQCAIPLTATDSPEHVSKTERRLVTVLFADLTGYTTFSEGRDPEEVRKFLTEYFDRSRAVIERFGGIVEKFIGDAVMAVWGADVAHEDDAERAVRAGFELAELVDKLAADIGVSDLQLRVGVHTGEAAVETGKEHMGFVTGDLVNTASRLEAVAEPGTVLVGDSTRQAASRAISFEAVGEQNLKGKSIPVSAWRAVRIVSGVGGEFRAEALEPPFVGRTSELRLLKDVLDTVKTESQVRLVSIVGEAGIGKSRVARELKKYGHGLVELPFWHEGRSPAYGDGVTFWAVAEMIRARSGLLETATDDETYRGLDTALEAYVDNPRDREWLRPRLAAVLGTGEAPPGDRQELDAAVRAFFEGLATERPVVMIFEDLHWADGAMLDFIVELTEWWTEQPVMIVTLARPDLLERRPTWGSGSNVISLSLGPLNDTQMAGLVTGTVPGIPEEAVNAIVERAAGVPLYAVELIRGLLAAGDLEAGDDGYRIIGDLSEMTVPESLRAVIGARLDRFEADDRDLIQDAAVLGQSFTLEALSALTGLEAGELETRMAPIAKREVIAAIRDPRSPEHGQYQFVQSLIREVALSRMSKDLRRERHLAVAKHMEALNEPELAAVVATHYLNALEATPAGEERERLQKRALGSMKTAVERAVNVRSHEQVISISEQAVEMADSDEERAPFWEHIAVAATAQARTEEAELYAKLAIDHYRQMGDQNGEWRAIRLLGFDYAENYEWRRVVELLDPIVRRAEDLTVNPELARLAALQARAESLVFMGTGKGGQHALELSEAALQAVEILRLVPEIAEALITRATILGLLGRNTESTILHEGAIELADEHDLYQSQTRGRNNFLLGKNLLDIEAKIALEEEARQIGIKAGHRHFNALATELIANLRIIQGDFDEARRETADLGSESAYPGFRYWEEAFISAWEGDEAKLRSAVESRRQLIKTRPTAVEMVSVGDLEAIEHVFVGSAFEVEAWMYEALSNQVSVTVTDLETLLLASLGSGDREMLEHFIKSTARWSPQLDALHDYLVELAAAADGDLSLLESLEQRVEKFIVVPLVPLALALVLVTAQYIPEDDPKRQELLDRARETADERGWHGFIGLMDRTT